MREEIIAILQETIQGRINRKIVPAHATLRDLTDRIKAEPKVILAELAALRRDGVIEGGHTINGYWIKFTTQ